MKRSRINQRLQKQTQRNLVFIIAGAIGILIIFLFFGIKLLVNFSLLVEKKADSNIQQQESSFLIPPILDPITTATNSASMDISGTAGSGKYVVIYINGKQLGKADIKEENVFVFKDLTLDEGENDIKIKAVDDNKKESKFSPTVQVTYTTKSPDLTVDFPTDGQTYHKSDNPIKIRGKTDPDAKVTINDFWAVNDSDGNYSYNYLLKSGDNDLKITATDEAGNKSEKTLRVTYSE